jgi:formylglycine-generating enzyme required for sulfatase activity
MIKVEAGTFDMGATSEQQDPDFYDAMPVHNVTLTKDYYIGKTEVTQALWKAVMGSNRSYFKGDRKPVDDVSWNDCQTFISRLNAATGKNFRLPTEAEWEFAARGGKNSKHYQYSGSNNLRDVAWYDDNSNSTTHNVATKKPNELGIYDMSGNVWEWCSDWYGDYGSNAQYDPAGPNSGYNRVRRGGSWLYGATRCRSSYRGHDGPDDRYTYHGLRLALSE